MGWVEQTPPCEHPGRPEAAAEREGQVWHCEHCDRRYVVAVLRLADDDASNGIREEPDWEDAR